MIVTRDPVNNSILMQSSPGDVVEGQRNGKLGHSCGQSDEGYNYRLYESWVRDHVVHLGLIKNFMSTAPPIYYNLL